jgi:hypothetical protein
MLQGATHENRAEDMQKKKKKKSFAQFEGKFLIGGVFNVHRHS